MSYRVASTLLLFLAVLSLAGCDKATPVAPDGTVLIVSASPSQISLTGTSTVTVVGRRPDGNPLNPGTEIRLSVDKGTIDPIVTADGNGTAKATFRADGRPGVATITAAAGAGMVTAKTEIQVGQSDATKPTLLISANPTIIPIQGSSNITIIARNADGSAAANQDVLVTTTLGSLGNGQRSSITVTTGNDGRAGTTLHAGNQSGTARLSAILGSSAEVTQEIEIRDVTLVLQVTPASIQRPANDTDQVRITLTARVTGFDRSPVAGIAVTFQTTRGTITPVGTVSTNSDGVATAMVVIRRSDLNADDTSFQVTASIPSGSGDPISQTATITVTSQ
jgi:hypothetical protein